MCDELDLATVSKEFKIGSIDTNSFISTSRQFLLGYEHNFYFDSTHTCEVDIMINSL